jgi:hypothetical protein
MNITGSNGLQMFKDIGKISPVALFSAEQIA